MNKIKVLAVVSALAASVLLMASCAEDIKDNSSKDKETSSSVAESAKDSSSVSDSEKNKDSKEASDSKTDGKNSAADNAAGNNGGNNDSATNNSDKKDDSSKHTGGIVIEDELNLDELDSNGSVAPNAEQGWGALM